MNRWLQIAFLVLAATFVDSTHPSNAVIQTPLPQLWPVPGPAPAPTTPAPLPPPINPGYAPSPADGLSPILSEPGPLYELPQPTPAPYPRMQLPGPIDQQKMQAYRNSLRAQQWQLQSQGLSPGSERSLEIQQQLSAPDPQ